MEHVLSGEWMVRARAGRGLETMKGRIRDEALATLGESSDAKEAKN